jgi:hypothetical protein
LTSHTASEIAHALGNGTKRQSVQQMLLGVPRSTQKLSKGNLADAWIFAALPAHLQQRLEAVAKETGCRDAIDLLARPSTRCEPTLLSSRIAPGAITLASQRREVLLDFLKAKDTETRTQVELEASGIAAYQRVFGHPCSGRWFRALYYRAIARDHNQGDWMRLELYLDENAGAAPAPGREDENKFNHDDLGAEIRSTIAEPKRKRKRTKDRAGLTKLQKCFIWFSAWRHLNALAPVDSNDRESAKRSIRRYLLGTVPVFAASPDALKRNFDRKCSALDKAHGKPSAIADRRELDSGWYRGPKISEQAHNVIVAYAVLECGGRVAQAWRDYTAGKIPGIVPDKELLEYYIRNPASKSYVPRRVSEAVKYEVAAMETLHHGTYQYEQSAHLKLDDSSIYAGDYWSSDDCTLPVYFYLTDDKGGFTMMRGQLLLTVDHRSRCILGFALIPATSYDSISIRNHIVDVADEHGLPRRGFIWERGMWRNAKLLKGAANADEVPPEEAELGLQQFGLDFIHRHSPKAKIIEIVNGLIQNRMEGEPGYCGRDEKTELFERFQDLKADVEAGRVSPAGKLYSFEQWVDRLHEIFTAYNREAYDRDSKLAGLTPAQAYEAWQNQGDEPIRFDASVRYLLSTHRRVATVTSNGIKFECGKRDYFYRNSLTGDAKVIGRKVLVWFNPESPDVAYVTDLQRQNPFAVEWVNAVPTVGASKDQLAEEMKKMRDHQAPIRALYRTLKAEFKQVFRKNLVSPEVLATGRAFEEGAEQIRSQRNATARKSRQVRQTARELGVGIPDRIDDPDALNEALQMEREVQEQRRARAQRMEENKP